MQYTNLLIEEKRKLLSIVKHEYVSLDFSKLHLVLDDNYGEPLWMSINVLLYKLNIKSPDIIVFDILLKKLSEPFMRFYFKDQDKRYIAKAQDFLIKQYVWYMISKEPVTFSINTQYIPQREYIRHILKLNKFNNCGIYLKHVSEDKFLLDPIGETISNKEDAELLYNVLIELQDLVKSLRLSTSNFIENYATSKVLAKDKRMIATLSNILSSFDCEFVIQNDYVTIPKTHFVVKDEESAMDLQAKIIDAYHFFRNVINTENKKDIVSEIYNKKVAPEIKKEFEQNLSTYIKLIKNKDLIDWIITISKESKYTLKIDYDMQGVFYIDGAIIVTPQDAKEYYIDYMDKKKEKLAMMVYNNNIVSKIKKVWSILKAKFTRKIV